MFTDPSPDEADTDPPVDNYRLYVTYLLGIPGGLDAGPAARVPWQRYVRRSPGAAQR